MLTRIKVSHAQKSIIVILVIIVYFLDVTSCQLYDSYSLRGRHGKWYGTGESGSTGRTYMYHELRGAPAELRGFTVETSTDESDPGPTFDCPLTIRVFRHITRGTVPEIQLLHSIQIKFKDMTKDSASGEYNLGLRPFLGYALIVANNWFPGITLDCEESKLGLEIDDKAIIGETSNLTSDDCLILDNSRIRIYNKLVAFAMYYQNSAQNVTSSCFPPTPGSTTTAAGGGAAVGGGTTGGLSPSVTPTKATGRVRRLPKLSDSTRRSLIGLTLGLVTVVAGLGIAVAYVNWSIYKRRSASEV